MGSQGRIQGGKGAAAPPGVQIIPKKNVRKMGFLTKNEILPPPPEN